MANDGGMSQMIAEIPNGFQSIKKGEEGGAMGIESGVVDHDVSKSFGPLLEGAFSEGCPLVLRETTLEDLDESDVQSAEIEDEVSNGAGPVPACGKDRAHARTMKSKAEFCHSNEGTGGLGDLEWRSRAQQDSVSGARANWVWEARFPIRCLNPCPILSVSEKVGEGSRRRSRQGIGGGTITGRFFV